MSGGKLKPDWTRDDTGRSNSSILFNDIVDDVVRMIRNEGASLIMGYTHGVARGIVARIAHVHGLAPQPKKPFTAAIESRDALHESRVAGLVGALRDAVDILLTYDERFQSLGRVHHIACTVGPTKCVDHRNGDFLDRPDIKAVIRSLATAECAVPGGAKKSAPSDTPGGTR
jgi:hypothetical protein